MSFITVFIYGTLFATELLCDVHDVVCLQSKSVEEVLKAQSHTVWIPWPLSATDDLPWQPVIDGKLIFDQPLELMKRGQIAPNVSVQLGTVKNETCSFVYEAFKDEIPLPVYNEMIKLLYKENASLLLEMYVPESNDGRNAISRMATDFFFYCPTRRAASALSKITNTYFASYCNGSACHGSEMVFVFNSAQLLPNGKFHNENEEIFANEMLGKWATFAHSDGYWVNWPLYNATTDFSYVFDIPFSIMSGYHSAECNFWDNFY